MAIVINEVVTETVVAQDPAAAATGPASRSQDEIELVVRRATERVLETLRREWDR